ncbi:MAG: hypothetical protein LEGION0398_MBIBDBAK_00651 [Legionellaceae bacterium]
MELSNPLLTQLKDIHLPLEPSWWPLPIGWYFIFIFLISLVCFLSYYGFKYSRRNHYRKLALMALTKLTYEQNGDPNLQLAQLSILLKRTALTAYPHLLIANLYGEAWLNFLDKTSNTVDFSQGVGRILLDAPYQKNTPIPTKEIINLSKKWIMKHKL